MNGEFGNNSFTRTGGCSNKDALSCFKTGAGGELELVQIKTLAGPKLLDLGKGGS
jgi:hypothetical protein